MNGNDDVNESNAPEYDDASTGSENSQPLRDIFQFGDHRPLQIDVLKSWIEMVAQERGVSTMIAKSGKYSKMIIEANSMETFHLVAELQEKDLLEMNLPLGHARALAGFLPSSTTTQEVVQKEKSSSEDSGRTTISNMSAADITTMITQTTSSAFKIVSSSKPLSKLKTCKSPRDFHNWLYMVQSEVEDNYPEIAEVLRSIADEPKESVVRGKCMISTSHISPAEEMQVLKMVKKAIPEDKSHLNVFSCRIHQAV